ncbi:MAG: hypothetical protein H0X51_07075 [Parachlamydiaceae bacterium]|nr:hypothetical protein [Parachlamydiaceae bacterium]
MKKKLIYFCLFQSLFLFAAKSNPDDRIDPCIYLCSRLTEGARLWNNVITEEIKDYFQIFRPQDINLKGVTDHQLDWVAYQADLKGMQGSDLLLVLPPYGRDCAWEIGWFCGQDRVAIAYAESKDDWLRDAMVKGGLTAIVTNNKLLYDNLMADPATANKSYLIPDRQDLGKIIRQIYEQTEFKKCNGCEHR